MPDRDAAFVGSVPENYDRYLGPLLFHRYADDLVGRLAVTPGLRVLETACGTGIVTERLARRLGAQEAIIATDLNEPMLAYARSKGTVGPGVTWRQADATALPFETASFDAVVCQFGLMFFPDKAQGVREAWRVLRSGGAFVFNVWDSFAHNPVVRIVHETVARIFPESPPQFYTVPFAMHDVSAVRRLLEAGGFEDVDWERVDGVGESPSSSDAVRGLIEGNPIYQTIMERRPSARAEIEAAVAAKLAATLGERPLRAPLRAIFFSGRRTRAV